MVPFVNGPNCQCADLGLNYCEIGDESLCRDREMEMLEMLETSNDIVSSTTTDAILSALPTLGHGRFGTTPRHCIHSLDHYELDNGRTVYLSSVIDARRYRDWIPDIGIYFDGSWDTESESFTYLVPWEDYGLPLVDMPTFTKYVDVALWHIANGETVDIGCVGGHGRTGTFLACLDIASSGGTMGARRAIEKVRHNHCWQAIETSEQSWFVKCFRAHIRGEEMPKRPQKKYAPSKGTNTKGKGGK